MKINQEHILLPNGEVQIGNLIIGSGGFVLIEAAKKRRATMAKIRLAEMIEEAMEKERLNQSELAKFLNVSRQAVNKMLNGSTNFTVETLIRLEEVLYADFISSALYKDEAMRREYGVHYVNGEDFDYATSIPTAISKHFDNKTRLELGLQELVDENFVNVGRIRVVVAKNTVKSTPSVVVGVIDQTVSNLQAGEYSYAMAA